MNPENERVEEDARRKEHWNKKAIFLLVFILLTGIIMVVGSSYALLTIQLKGEETNRVTIGTFDIQFKEGMSLNLSNEKPLSEAQGLAQDPYSFTIKNAGTVDAKYRIYLEGKEEDNQISKNYLRLAYQKKDATPKVIRLSDLDENLTLVSEVSLKAGESDTWEIRFWLDQDAPNSFQGKNFSFKVQVEAIQNVNVEAIGTSPIIYLNEGIENVAVGQTYIDPGVSSVSDAEDGVLPNELVMTSYEFYNPVTEELVTVPSAVTTDPGVLFIHYQVSDSNGNLALVTRSVTVGPLSTANLTLVGDTFLEVPLNEEYVDPGYNSLTPVKVLSTPNTNVKGVYSVKYVTVDANGSAKGISRIVRVK